MATRTLTLDNHDEVVADGIVLIDFWASWCGPCLRFAPIFEDASDRHGDIAFVKVDTEAEQELAARYEVSAIPTLVVYRDGIPVFGQAGALPAGALEDLIRQVRSLDMDEVRRTYAEQLAAEDGAGDGSGDGAPEDPTPADAAAELDLRDSLSSVRSVESGEIQRS